MGPNLTWRIENSDVRAAYQNAYNLGSFLERCATLAYDDDGAQEIALSDFADDELDALIEYYYAHTTKRDD